MLVSKVSKNILEELKQVLNQLDIQCYSSPLGLLSNSTIGQHTRHILEFYQCFIEGFATGQVDYDLRRRNVLIETSPDYACEIIDMINKSIVYSTDQKIMLKYSNSDEYQFISSSVERELAYNIEHAIHHMAIIKIAIKNNFPVIDLPEDFGVAQSTIKYHNQRNVHS